MRRFPASTGIPPLALRGGAAALALALLVLLFVTLRPETDPGEVDVRIPRPEPAPSVVGSAPAPAPPEPSSSSGPSVLQGESWRLGCAAGELDEGPVGFVRLEAYGPVARRLVVADGRLEGEADLPDGEGDLVRGGRAVGRLRWHQAEGEAVCEVAPVPWVEVAGAVVDAEGRPQADVSVSGCGAHATTGADGAFAFQVPEGRACKVRALRAGPPPASSPAAEVVAPAAAVTLELAPREVEDVVVDLQRELRVLGSLDALERQKAEALGQPAPEPSERTERMDRLREALASEDQERILQEWSSSE